MKRGCIIDIETDGFEKTSKIVLVGLLDIDTGLRKIYDLQRSDYDAVKCSLKEDFENYDILIGYNIKDFDMPIIKNFFGLEFYGKLIDLYLVIKNKKGLLKLKLANFKMRTVGEAMGLSVSKGTIDYNVLKRVMNETERELVIDYLVKDLKVTEGIFRYLDKYFSDFKDFLSPRDIEIYNHFACNTGTFAYKFLCRLINVPETYGVALEEKKKYVGGYVMEPRTEYAENVYCFDFNSLYPHIMMMANLFSKGEWKGGEFELNGAYNDKEWHIISKELKRIYDLRVEYKKQKNPKEYVLKIVINTIYGLTANPVFLQFYDKDLAGDCTKIGRELLKRVCKGFEEKGYKVLYGDTDSLYVEDVFKDKVKLTLIKDEIVDNLRSLFPFPVDSFKMGLDHEIKRVVFFRKKLYMFQNSEDKIVIKGLQIIKENATALSMKIFKDHIENAFISTGKYQYTFEEIKNWCYKYLKENPRLIGKCLNLKPLNYYKGKTNIYYKLSEIYGEGMMVFIPNFNRGAGNEIKYVLLEDAKDIDVQDMSIRSTLLELADFCSEKDLLTNFAMNEKKIDRKNEVLSKWL